MEYHKINFKYIVLALIISSLIFLLSANIVAAVDFSVLGGNVNRTGYVSGHGPDSLKPYWVYGHDPWNRNVYRNSQGTIATLSVAKNGFLFTITESGHLFTLEIENRKNVWLTDLGARPAGLVADEQNIYVTMAEINTVYAFDQKNGKKVWQSRTKKSMSNSLPLVIDKYLVVGDDAGFVNAFNKQTGKLAWQKNLGEVIHSSPAFGEGLIFIGTEDEDSAVFALTLGNGDIVWKFPIDKVERSSIRVNLFHGTPTYQDGKVYIGGENWYFYVLSAKTGKLIWKHEFDGWFTSAPALDNRNIYIGNWNGNFYALSQHTGDVVWIYNVVKDASFGISSYGPSGEAQKQGMNSWPIVTDSKVFFGADNGYFYALDKTGKLLWKEKYGSAWPILINDILIIPNHPPPDALKGEMIVALSNNLQTKTLDNDYSFSKTNSVKVSSVWVAARVVAVLMSLGIMVYFYKRWHQH